MRAFPYFFTLNFLTTHIYLVTHAGESHASGGLEMLQNPVDLGIPVGVQIETHVTQRGIGVQQHPFRVLRHRPGERVRHVIHRKQPGFLYGLLQLLK